MCYRAGHEELDPDTDWELRCSVTTLELRRMNQRKPETDTETGSSHHASEIIEIPVTEKKCPSHPLSRHGSDASNMSNTSTASREIHFGDDNNTIKTPISDRTPTACMPRHNAEGEVQFPVVQTPAVEVCFCPPNVFK